MQNKSILIAILCSLLWVFFQNSLFAQILIPPDELQYPPLKFQMLKADRVELPNGITMFFLEDRELPLVHMNFLFRTGTVNDPRRERRRCRTYHLLDEDGRLQKIHKRTDRSETRPTGRITFFLDLPGFRIDSHNLFQKRSRHRDGTPLRNDHSSGI